MNRELRAVWILKDVKQWQIARALGIGEVAFSRLLRQELSPEKKQEIIEIIDRLSKGGSANV